MEINWAELIEDLEGAEMPLKDIADHIGLTSSSVSDIKNGRSKAPGGTAAVLLYQLHQQKCGKRHGGRARAA